MPAYRAPLRDMRFVLQELHEPASQAFDAELIDNVLEEAGRFAEDFLLPLNAPGDATGCLLENGVVRTPPGFPEAYRRFREAGWQAMGGDPAYGGQGLPETVNKLVEEMLCSTNLSFSLYSILTHSACNAIRHHATDALKDLYLPRMTEGSWSGTMCLTEPQAGTDLALLRTRAVPQSDGTFHVTGSKIFITAGEHDLTENIVHLVLARLPDAPPGVKGISLFLVPKFLPTPDGRLGPRNGVLCAAIEHKMGIRASATCQLQFDEAVGWMIGAPHKGLRAMFTMMNSARLSVGIEGVGIAEAAYQGAFAYARDRVQGRSSEAEAPQSILTHPDVQRMLLTMRAHAEGGRMLGVWLAQQLDTAETATGSAKLAAEEFAALLTPVVKALCTDLGFEAASLGVQVFGGHGYIRDHGMEQLVRDARIAMLYEGTNGVQAMDLVGRKLPFVRHFSTRAETYVAAHADDATMAPFVRALDTALGRLARATTQVAAAPGAGATDYLRLLGLVMLAYLWVKAAARATQAIAAGDDEAGFYRTKLATARFFVDKLLPQTLALEATIATGDESLTVS